MDGTAEWVPLLRGGTPRLLALRPQKVPSVLDSTRARTAKDRTDKPAGLMWTKPKPAL